MKDEGDAEARTAEEIDADVQAALRSCFDPEIPVNIVELGLVYEVRIRRNRSVLVSMTLTSPNCPVAQSLPNEVKEKVGKIPGVTFAEVAVVWDPPWTQERMSEAAKLELGFL